MYIIFAGTKYCGPGNKSTGIDDLGRFRNVDLCCRDHDLCPDNIPAGEYKHGLHNTAKYTKYVIILFNIPTCMVYKASE